MGHGRKKEAHYALDIRQNLYHYALQFVGLLREA
jgi:hypothetical protein